MLLERFIMAKVIMLLIGSALLILSAVMAMQTREFVRTAHSAEGKVGLGDVTTGGKKSTREYIEFWIKNKDYQPPRDELLSFYKGLSSETVMMLTKSHTRYRFASYNGLIGMDREKIPILYDPQSLPTAKGNNLYKELDSSQAMVNTFASLYAYSIMLFIPGSLLLAGSLLAFLKSKYMGLRYFIEEKTAAADALGGVKCPGCKVAFNTKDHDRWDYERHTSCGQKIKILG